MDKQHKKVIDELTKERQNVEKALKAKHAADLRKARDRARAALEKFQADANGAEPVKEAHQGLAKYLEDTAEEGDRILVQADVQLFLGATQKAMKDLKEAIAKKDGERVLKFWKEVQEKSKPLREDEQNRFGEFGDVKAFLAEYAELEARIEGDADTMQRQKAATGYLAKAGRTLADLKKAIEKEDGEGGEKLWKQLQEQGKPLVDDTDKKYAEFEDVHKFLHDYNELAPTVEQECVRLIRLRFAKGVIAKAAGPLKQATTALAKDDGEGAKRALAGLKDAGKPLLEDAESKFAGFDIVQKFLSEVEEVRSKVEGDADAMILKRDMENALAKCTKALGAVNEAIAKEDGPNLKARWKVVVDSATPFLGETAEKFSHFEKVQEFLTKYNALHATVEADAEKFIALTFAKGVIAKAQKPLDQAKQALTKNDGETAKKAYAQLQELIKPLVEEEAKFGSFEIVQKFVADAHDVGSKVEADADALIVKRDMEQHFVKADKALTQLNESLRAQDGETIKKRWAALVDAARPFVGDDSAKYAHFDKVKDFVEKYNALAPRVENDADRMIREKFSTGLIERCDKLWAEGLQAIDKEDGDKLLRTWKKLKEDVKPLTDDAEGKYKEFANATAFVAKYEKLTTWVDGEADRLIRKKEALTHLRPLKELLHKTRTAVDKKDGEAAAKFWQELKDRSKVVLEADAKYGEFTEVSEFTTEFTELSHSIETTSQALIIEKQARAVETKATKLLAEVKEALVKKDGDAALRKWQQLLDLAKPIVEEEKFQHLDFVQTFNKDFAEIKETAEPDAKRLIAQKQAAEIVARCQQTKTNIAQFVGKSDAASAKQYLKALQEKAKPLLEDAEGRFAEFEVAQKFLEEYNALKGQVEAL
eukprot:TRINITY_DN23824_c0_g1_i1.p1 TRINITY_DN23824_c0_g1~~TRINITY_DN23824_c0_g1_i1.p1  ORF type:complete len:879 (+),score=244.20 TRINITY_DN23824_c0_g1_i1:29-2665(+)